MLDPFRITEPTCISFSGGRTSAYMLWRVLQSNGGLPAEAVVCFANTGKEREETLEFVRDCAEHWSVPIVWVEFVTRRKENGFALVNFDTASRNGEPFDRLISEAQYLPNVIHRTCTQELKVRPMERYLDGIGMAYADMLLGIRADEPRRTAKNRSNRILPLVVADVRKAEVHAFWRASSFDLDLPYEDGHGNCDLCFLKGEGVIRARIRENPQRAVWWAAKEEQTGAKFHKNRDSYASMLRFAADQLDMFDPDEEAIACFCGD